MLDFDSSFLVPCVISTRMKSVRPHEFSAFMTGKMNRNGVTILGVFQQLRHISETVPNAEGYLSPCIQGDVAGRHRRLISLPIGDEEGDRE